MSLLQPFILIISCDFQTTDSELEKILLQMKWYFMASNFCNINNNNNFKYLITQLSVGHYNYYTIFSNSQTYNVPA